MASEIGMAERAPPRIVLRLALGRDSDVAQARLRVRELGARHGFTAGVLEALATATSEVARNVIVHAGDGELLLGTIEDGDRLGIVVIARDQGPGIPNLDDAMRDGFSTGGTLGLGLPGARRLVHEFDLQSAPGQGTRVTLTQWRTPPRA